MVERECFVLEIQNKARNAFSLLPFYIILEDLASAIRNGNTRQQTRKERTKLSLLADEIIVYTG